MLSRHGMLSIGGKFKPPLNSLFKTHVNAGHQA